MRVARRVGPVRALIAMLAAFTAGFPLVLLARSPAEAEDPMVMAAILPLFLLPAGIAIVGLVRDSMPLVGAAGALCFLPAIIGGWPVFTFAGFLAIAGLPRGPLPSGRELLRGVAVVIFGFAAWMVPYLGMDPFARIDAPRVGLGIAMVLATIGLAVGRPLRRPTLGLAR